jgi:hypothetical protein
MQALLAYVLVLALAAVFIAVGLWPLGVVIVILTLVGGAAAARDRVGPRRD